MVHLLHQSGFTNGKVSYCSLLLFSVTQIVFAHICIPPPHSPPFVYPFPDVPNLVVKVSIMRSRVCYFLPNIREMYAEFEEELRSTGSSILV